MKTKNKRITVRLNEQQFVRLTEAVENDASTYSSFIRECIITSVANHR